MKLNKVIYFYFILVLLLVNSCSQSNNNDSKTNSEQVNDTSKKVIIPSIDKISKKYSDTVDKTIVIIFGEPLPQLEFKVISKSAFLSHKKNHLPKLILDSSKIVLDDYFLTIQTSKARLKFNKTNFNTNDISIDGQSWANYKGFIENRKMYVMESWWNGEFELGELFLIDSIFNIKYEINSVFDNPFEPPILSQDGQYMAFYANGMMTGTGEKPEHNSFIGILKLTNGDLSLKPIASFGTSGWNIKDLVWLDDNSLALKINTPEYNGEKWIDNFSYLMAKFPKK